MPSEMLKQLTTLAQPLHYRQSGLSSEAGCIEMSYYFNYSAFEFAGSIPIPMPPNFTFRSVLFALVSVL